MTFYFSPSCCGVVECGGARPHTAKPLTDEVKTRWMTREEFKRNWQEDPSFEGDFPETSVFGMAVYYATDPALIEALKLEGWVVQTSFNNPRTGNEVTMLTLHLDPGVK